MGKAKGGSAKSAGRVQRSRRFWRSPAPSKPDVTECRQPHEDTWQNHCAGASRRFDTSCKASHITSYTHPGDIRIIMIYSPTLDRTADNHREISSGNGVDARQKFSLKLVFPENNGFNQEKTGQFSGLLAPPFFKADYRSKNERSTIRAQCGRNFFHRRWPSDTDRFNERYLLRCQSIQIIHQRVDPDIRRIDLFLEVCLFRTRVSHQNLFFQVQHPLYESNYPFVPCSINGVVKIRNVDQQIPKIFPSIQFLFCSGRFPDFVENKCHSRLFSTPHKYRFDDRKNAVAGSGNSPAFIKRKCQRFKMVPEDYFPMLLQPDPICRVFPTRVLPVLFAIWHAPRLLQVPGKHRLTAFKPAPRLGHCRWVTTCPSLWNKNKKLVCCRSIISPDYLPIYHRTDERLTRGSL